MLEDLQIPMGGHIAFTGYEANTYYPDYERNFDILPLYSNQNAQTMGYITANGAGKWMTSFDEELAEKNPFYKSYYSSVMDFDIQGPPKNYHTGDYDYYTPQIGTFKVTFNWKCSDANDPYEPNWLDPIDCPGVDSVFGTVGHLRNKNQYYKVLSPTSMNIPGYMALPDDHWQRTEKSVTNANDCTTLCANTAGCTYFSFFDNGKCEMIFGNNFEVKTTNVPSAMKTSGKLNGWCEPLPFKAEYSKVTEIYRRFDISASGKAVWEAEDVLQEFFAENGAVGIAWNEWTYSQDNKAVSKYVTVFADYDIQNNDFPSSIQDLLITQGSGKTVWVFFRIYSFVR